MNDNLSGRKGEAEKKMLSIASTELKKISNETKYEIDLSKFTYLSKGQGRCYISSEGEMVKTKTKKANPLNGDSKTIDGFVQFKHGKKNFDVMIFCKYTKSRGGIQDSISYEINAFIKSIEKRNALHISDNNEIYVIYLDGDYWNTKGAEHIKNINRLPSNVMFCNIENFYSKLITKIKF